MSSDTGPSGHDTEYLSQRAAQERLAAERSSDPSARRVHETLAEGYAEKLRATMPAV